MDKKEVYKKAITILLVLTLAILLANYSNPTGNIIYNPLNCSQGDISAIWGSIFEDSSAGITIVKDTACQKFYAYKINSNEASLIIGNTNLGNWITAAHGNFNQEFIDSLEANNLNDFVPTTLEISFPPEEESNLTKHAKNRSINQTEGKSTFDSIFKLQSESWVEATDATNTSRTSYVFIENTPSGNELNSSSGYVEANLTLEQYLFLRTIQDCETNWTKQKTTCGSSETQIEYYIDSNSCETDPPEENETIDCDYQKDGVIGEYSDVNIKNLNFNIKTSNSSLNESTNLSEKQVVRIFNKDKEIVRFDWNFSEKPINLKEIKVEKQSNSSSFGYVIINGINTSKEIKLDRKSSSTKVCIKDSKITSISQITSSCNGTAEHLLSCPKTSGKYTCSITTSEFTVSGMENSAVKEFITGAAITCTPLWDCSEWTACSGGSKTRTCTDTNSCGSTSAKPPETQTCGTTCTPNWECTSWTPEECPKEETQERTCTDSNSCEAISTKPSEEKTCTYAGTSSKKIWIITFFVILILAVIAILVISMIKRKKGDSSNIQQNVMPRSPPGTPPNRPRRMPPPRRQMRRPPVRAPSKPL
tara:strand:- start:22588 stop:24360 length:1773 start_codon:yes stop_codon:yes gene_type:complete